MRVLDLIEIGNTGGALVEMTRYKGDFSARLRWVKDVADGSTPSQGSTLIRLRVMQKGEIQKEVGLEIYIQICRLSVSILS